MVWFFGILSALLTIVTIGLTFIVRAQLTINKTLEEAINAFYSQTERTFRLMKLFDDRQMFESDDEVGTVFKQLRETLLEMEKYVTEMRDDGFTTETEEER